MRVCMPMSSDWSAMWIALSLGRSLSCPHREKGYCQVAREPHLARYFPYWESSGSKGSPNEIMAWILGSCKGQYLQGEPGLPPGPGKRLDGQIPGRGPTRAYDVTVFVSSSTPGIRHLGLQVDRGRNRTAHRRRGDAVLAPLRPARQPTPQALGPGPRHEHQGAIARDGRDRRAG